MNTSKAVSLLFMLLAGLWAFGPVRAAADIQVTDSFHVGGDFRLRQEAYDYIPVRDGGYARGGENDYFRFRTRLWFELKPAEFISFHTRLLNEVFQHVAPSNSKKSRWPDELVFDQLNVAFHLLDGDMKWVLGRQDIMFPGHHRLLGEGTPKDGSRSVYMDGVSGRWLLNDKKTQLSFFAVYNQSEDPLAIGNVNRDVTGYGATPNGMDEAGSGFFWDQTFSERLSAGLYYIWKHDTAWVDDAGGRQPNEDIHTVGALLKAKPLERTTVEVEVAGQWSPTSDSDRRAMMAATGIRHQFDAKPYIGLQSLYLTGDNPDTERCEGWNPLWGRYPWLNEVLGYTFDSDGIFVLQNMWYTYLEGGIHFKPGHRLAGTLGWLYAPEADGSGGGHHRGAMGTVQYDFPLWSSAAENGPKVYGHVVAQGLQPNNYYENDNHLAYMLRWELSFRF